jgi:hypothetical protein
MKIFWSATHGGFYSEGIQYDPLPDDLIEITIEYWNKLLSGQGNGKMIGSDNTGYPVLVDNPPLTPEQSQREAERQKQYRLSQALNAITPLQYAVDLQMETKEEQASLLAWKKYCVLLNRVDCSKAPNIDWPKAPE